MQVHVGAQRRHYAPSQWITQAEVTLRIGSGIALLGGRAGRALFAGGDPVPDCDLSGPTRMSLTSSRRTRWRSSTMAVAGLPRSWARKPSRSSPYDTISLIGRFAAHCDDSMIAKVLNQQQRRTATGMSFTPANRAIIRKRVPSEQITQRALADPAHRFHPRPRCRRRARRLGLFRSPPLPSVSPARPCCNVFSAATSVRSTSAPDAERPAYRATSPSRRLFLPPPTAKEQCDDQSAGSATSLTVRTHPGSGPDRTRPSHHGQRVTSPLASSARPGDTKNCRTHHPQDQAR